MRTEACNYNESGKDKNDNDDTAKNPGKFSITFSKEQNFMKSIDDSVAARILGIKPKEKDAGVKKYTIIQGGNNVIPLKMFVIHFLKSDCGDDNSFHSHQEKLVSNNKKKGESYAKTMSSKTRNSEEVSRIACSIRANSKSLNHKKRHSCIPSQIY